MAEESKSDPVEKFLSEQKNLEDRKQALIQELLNQKEAALQAFDDKLAKLGYVPKDGAGGRRRSHHKKTAEQGSKPKGS